jgi:hypothetical protein
MGDLEAINLAVSSAAAIRVGLSSDETGIRTAWTNRQLRPDDLGRFY